MKQFWFQIVVLFIVIFAGMYYATNQELVNKQFNNLITGQNVSKRIAIVSADGSSTRAIINIEVADTEDKRKKGLSGRTSLPQDSGVLFVFDKTFTPVFWMKGMLFPIDIIWIRGDVVVDTLANVPAAPQGVEDTNIPKYSPNSEIDKVLEVNAGFIQNNSIQVGDKIQLLEQ